MKFIGRNPQNYWHRHFFTIGVDYGRKAAIENLENIPAFDIKFNNFLRECGAHRKSAIEGWQFGWHESQLELV